MEPWPRGLLGYSYGTRTRHSEPIGIFLGRCPSEPSIDEGESDKVEGALIKVARIAATIGRLGADLDEVVKSKGKEFADTQAKRAERTLTAIKRDLCFMIGCSKEELEKSLDDGKGALALAEHYLSEV